MSLQDDFWKSFVKIKSRVEKPIRRAKSITNQITLHLFACLLALEPLVYSLPNCGAVYLVSASMAMKFLGSPDVGSSVSSKFSSLRSGNGFIFFLDLMRF